MTSWVSVKLPPGNSSAKLRRRFGLFGFGVPGLAAGEDMVVFG